VHVTFGNAAKPAAIDLFDISAEDERSLGKAVRANLHAVQLDFGQSHIDMPQRH
jgi:hypothetical protein